MNKRSLIGLLEIVLLREARHYKYILRPIRLWKRSNNQEVRWLLVINSQPETADTGLPPRLHWTSHQIPSSLLFVAVMHIDQMMEPKDKAFQARLWSLQGILVCEVQARCLNKTWCFPHASSNMDTSFHRCLAGVALNYYYYFFFHPQLFQGLIIQNKVFCCENWKLRGSFVDTGQRGFQ